MSLKDDNQNKGTTRRSLLRLRHWHTQRVALPMSCDVRNLNFLFFDIKSKTPHETYKYYYVYYFLLRCYR